MLAAEGGAFIGAIYGEEEKAQKLGLRGDALRDHRQQYIRPIVRDFERCLGVVKPTLLPFKPLAAAIAYYNNHGTALFRFVDDPLVPIDKSPTEREFQNVAKLHLNMFFAGSTEGAHRASVLLGIHRYLHVHCACPSRRISSGPSNDSVPIAISSTFRSKR